MLKRTTLFLLGRRRIKESKSRHCRSWINITNFEVACEETVNVVSAPALTAAFCQLPHDYYHELHLPHDPPLYPVYSHAPPTQFTCAGRSRGYYADIHAGCQVYHFCWHQRLVSTDLCTNGTLFNQQFQVCDHFYNVRCGSPYEDLK